jgi:hypothetical protein
MPNAALICRTTTAFSACKPPILFEEPAAREQRVFANADGHDLARCYGFSAFQIQVLGLSFPRDYFMTIGAETLKYFDTSVFYVVYVKASYIA